MIYFPFLILFAYAYFVNIKNYDKLKKMPNKDEILSQVFWNIMISEAIYLFIYIFNIIPNSNFSFTNLLLFYVIQDIYFFCVHKYYFHKINYDAHKLHHSVKEIQPFLAWYTSKTEHIILNFGSMIMPMMLLSNSEYVHLFILIQQIYTSVDGHKSTSPHAKHHNNPVYRFGSIYLLDRLFGSY